MNKNKSITFIICTIVFIVVIPILYESVDEKNNTIERYHTTMIEHARSHLANVDMLIDSFNLDDKNYDELMEIKLELESTSEYIENFSIYYTYKEKGSYGGNFNIKVFFKAYYLTASDWAMAIKNNEENEMPSYKEIEDYKNDIKRIVERFEIYSLHEYNHDVKIEDLTFDQLSTIIIDLVKKTKCNAVKNNMPDPLDEYLVK